MGDFTEAARNADMAQQLAQFYGDPQTKLKAFRAQLEVRYASGDINAARDGLARLLEILSTAARPDAIPIMYGWPKGLLVDGNGPACTAGFFRTYWNKLLVWEHTEKPLRSVWNG